MPSTNGNVTRIIFQMERGENGRVNVSVGAQVTDTTIYVAAFIAVLVTTTVFRLTL